jgi:hypothetical protein
MKSDDVKREDDTEIILDTALRVETIEGVHLYLVSTIYNHPIHSKSLFRMGSL